MYLLRLSTLFSCAILYERLVQCSPAATAPAEALERAAVAAAESGAVPVPVAAASVATESGRRETAAHLMLCPDDSRTRLLVENVDELTTWMSRDNQTDPEILYWIPKYILMRGDKPLLTMGFLSPQFKALAVSQDLIGWRDFTEGHISTHFYAIQSFHLAMSSS